MGKVKVYYWHGIIVDDLIFAEYQNILEKLLAGDYQAADLDLKKLKGYRVYTARINQADRLVFTTIEKEGKSYLVVLDVIKNHDYQKASCLNPQVLRAYLERQEDAFKDLITQNNFIAMDKPLEMEHQDKEKLELQFVPLEYYQGMYLELDAEQKIVLKTQLPAIISGPPGSGKSCLAMAVITQGVLQTIDYSQPIVYVAESTHLREQMRISWQQHPASQSRPPNSVLFLSYEELLRRQLPQFTDFAAEGSSFFKDWYVKFERKEQKALQINVHSVASIYQELCILCAYDENEYLKLGKRQSLIIDNEHRKWLFHVYQSYQGYLAREKKIDFHLSQETLSATFPLIVVDEAQDYTASMLTQLSKLAQGTQVAICMDTLQSVKELMPHRVRFKLALKQRGINLQEHTLADTYRCSKEVIAVANQWLLLKHALLGGTADKLESSQIQSHAQQQGEVHWYEAPSDAEWELLRQTTQSNQVAIITAEEFRQEAIKLFHTPLVFTPEEIKGLEYQEVILYQPLLQKVFEKASVLLKEKFPDGALHATSYRSRNNEPPSDLGVAFCEIFTACTRAKKTLSIVQKKHHGLQFLAHHWQHAFPQESNVVVKTEIPASVSIDWQEEIIKQRAVGNERVAEEIERQKMNPGALNKYDLVKPEKLGRRKNKIAFFPKEKFIVKNTKQLSMELLNRADRGELLFAEEEGTCLFLQMLDNKHCFNIFLEQIQRLEHEKRRILIDEFNNNFMERAITYLPSLFHVLTKNISKNVFTDLYTLIKYLPKGSLLHPVIYHDYTIPLFVAISSSMDGRENMRNLRLIQATLFTDIPTEGLTRIYPGTGSFLAFMLLDEVNKKPSSFLDGLDKKYFSNLSADTLFTRMQSFETQLNGYSLFELIIEHYPDLFGKITIWFETDKVKALANLKDFLFYKAPNKPPLFYTLCAKKYALFFLNLLKNQLDDYQIATLFNSTDAYGMSAFHKLVVSMHGEIILNYLKNNNGWLSHLSVDLLTRVINKNNRQYTLLNELCETGSRNIILNMWIKSSMQIDELQLFHFTQEYHLGGGDDKYDEKFSGFYLLSQNTENNDTLQVLLNANSNLYCISPAALFAIKTETSNFPNTSIFYNLIESERGQKILAKIIDFNENLSTTIQVQHVLEPANTFISDMKETIPLYWLAFHYAETGLLHKIKNWEQFIENIHFRESLYKNFAKDKNEVINIARYLTESERGLNLLLSFLKNKQLAYLLLGQNSHKGALELDKKKHGDFFNIPEMQAFLYSLIENEHFKSEEIINLMLQKKIPHPESMEKIYNLTQSIPGLWLLNLLCTQSKKFRCILNELIYCWPYKNQENFSLFYELSSTKSGINLLQILAEDEEFNPKKLKKNYLINLKDNTLCVFSELIHTKKGQRLLSLIFEKDPEAIESTYPIIDQKMNHYGDETYPQSTFLYWLIYHYENTHLLDHFKGIKDEVWAVELSSNYESYSVSRPLEHLEKSESGRALLRKLFLKDSFCNTLLAYQENYVNEVFLDCITNRIQPLLYDSIGHSILRHFLLEQPHYLDELTAESMIQMMPTLKLGNALCAMCFKFTGQDVLIEIMQKRPDIAAKLTFDNFLQEMTDMEIIGFTPLYCLVKSDAGIDTLIKLIPLIPSLQQGLKGLMDKPHNEDMDHCSKLVRQFLDTLNNRELILNVLNETRLQSQATINVNQHTFFALQHEVQASSEQANDSVLNYE